VDEVQEVLQYSMYSIKVALAGWTDDEPTAQHEMNVLGWRFEVFHFERRWLFHHFVALNSCAQAPNTLDVITDDVSQAFNTTVDGYTVNVTQLFNTRRYHRQCYSAL